LFLVPNTETRLRLGERNYFARTQIGSLWTTRAFVGIKLPRNVRVDGGEGTSADAALPISGPVRQRLAADWSVGRAVHGACEVGRLPGRLAWRQRAAVVKHDWGRERERERRDQVTADASDECQARGHCSRYGTSPIPP